MSQAKQSMRYELPVNPHTKIKPILKQTRRAERAAATSGLADPGPKTQRMAAVTPTVKPSRMARLGRIAGPTALVGLGLGAALKHMYDAAPAELHINPAEQAALNRHAAKVEAERPPVQEPPAEPLPEAAQPGLIDRAKSWWSDLPAAGKWGIGTVGGGLAAYLLYRLLRRSRDRH